MNQPRLMQVETLRSLWSSKFPTSEFPEDFLSSWLPRHAVDIIDTFNRVSKIHKTDTALDTKNVARIISAQLKAASVRRENTTVYQAEATYPLFTQQWLRYFPSYELPRGRFLLWLQEKRQTNYAVEAFKATWHALRSSTERKTSDDICNIISAHMTKEEISRRHREDARLSSANMN